MCHYKWLRMGKKAVPRSVHANNKEKDREPPRGKKAVPGASKNGPSAMTVLGSVDTTYHPLSKELLDIAIAEAPAATPPPRSVNVDGFLGPRRPRSPCVKLHTPFGDDGARVVSAPTLEEAAVRMRVAELEAQLRGKEADVKRSERELDLLRRERRTIETQKVLQIPAKARTPTQSKFVASVLQARDVAARNPLLMQQQRLVALRGIPMPTTKNAPALPLVEALATNEQPGVRKGGKKLHAAAIAARPAPFVEDARGDPADVRVLDPILRPLPGDELARFAARSVAVLRKETENRSLKEPTRVGCIQVIRELHDIKGRLKAWETRHAPQPPPAVAPSAAASDAGSREPSASTEAAAP